MVALIARFIFLIATFATLSALGVLPAHDFGGKTVAQLLELLESTDGGVREDAALFLGYRYRKPGAVINPPTYKEQHPELPLPPQIIPRLIEHLKSDPDHLVRLQAMRALHDLRYRTNTTSLVVTGLEDTNALVRIWTCEALIDISHEYSDPLPARVVPTLAQSLSVDTTEDPAWLAAYIAGHLGAAGKELLPQLQALRSHKSAKVRQYAREAITSIQKAKRAD